jgi:hypothetical protein
MYIIGDKGKHQTSNPVATLDVAVHGRRGEFSCMLQQATFCSYIITRYYAHPDNDNHSTHRAQQQATCEAL